MKNMKLEWKRGDWAAYFGLMTNNLTNLLTMMGLLIFVVGIPKEIVYGRIAPAFGLAVWPRVFAMRGSACRWRARPGVRTSPRCRPAPARRRFLP
jgi:hypothetical protein